MPKCHAKLTYLASGPHPDLLGKDPDGVGAMINGAHIIIYSRDAEADKAFIKNILKFRHVDVNKGWLIFKLPPSEVAVHPSDENDMHEFYLMTDDLDAEMAALKKAGAACEEASQQAWGRLTRIKLPGGGTLGLYQARARSGPCSRRARTRPQRRSVSNMASSICRNRKRSASTWRYIGHVGTGFSHKVLEDLHAKLVKLTVSKSPFPAKVKDEAATTWVKPSLVAEAQIRGVDEQGRTAPARLPRAPVRQAGEGCRARARTSAQIVLPLGRNRPNGTH
jgi:hypothetical protein